MKLRFLKFILFATLISGCSCKNAILYIHKPEKDGGDIFGNPKNSFFHDEKMKDEIKSFKIKLNRQEVKDLEYLLQVLKSKDDSSNLELSEGPIDIALIYKTDTLYTYTNGWQYKKKMMYYETPLTKRIEKYFKK